MAKAKDIQINQSTRPLDVNNTPTPVNSQNNTPITTNKTTTPSTNTFKRWDPLWKTVGKPYLQASYELNPAKLLTEATTAATKAIINPSPELRPNDATEETLWGWNYWLDRAVSQADNEQGHYNALQNTWAMVWIPEQQKLWTLPSNQKWKRWIGVPWILPEQNTPSEQVVSPAPSATPTVKTTTKQPSVSQQNTPAQQQPTEPVVNPDEFWYGNRPETPEQAEEKIQANEQAIANMESDLMKSTAWKIYWKVTADQDSIIKTLQDDNSVYRSMAESRISTFKDLQTMDNWAIAAAIIANAMPSDSQAMRDLMQYDPAKYQEVQQQIKQLKWQMTINSITNGDAYPTFNNGNAITNDISDFAATYSNSATSTADILKNVNSSLNSNDAASTASETMASIESDMAVLQNRLKNLKKEASTVFKWDVPQYIVNAYVANRTAEIQDQMSILENRYNSAQSRYQQEWERTKRAAEFDLKKQELAMKREGMALDDWSTRQWIALKRAALNGTTNWTTPLSTLTLQESMNVLSNFSSSYANNSYGWQCGTFVKRYLSQIGVNLPNVSSLDSKMSLIDPSITDANDGDVVIMTSSKYPNNWHMAIVESVDDDGTLHLLESNWDNDELVHRRTVKPNDNSIIWYYRPTGWNGTGSSSYEWKNVSGGVFTRNDGLSFDLSGSSLFNSLNDTDKKTVIWLLNLQTDPNSLTTRMWYDKGQAQKLINAAQDINPAWKQDDFWNWQKVRQWWEKGKQWGWISRNWTAMKAAKELYEMVDEIDKFPSMTLNWLKNAAATEFWDPKIVKFKTTLEWFVTEAAGALKWWNAANATQDVARMDEILNQKMTKSQLKTSIRQLVDLLYGKNESEAMSVWEATYIKPNTPRIKEVADWMYNDLWIRGQELYYNYTPDGWWNVFNNASPSATQSQYSVQDILSL